MTCLDGNKLTKDNIRAGGVFSVNLVTESMLPLADYLGHKNSYTKDNLPLELETTPGSVLNVPIFKNSPFSYELAVMKTIYLEGSEIYICRICNVTADEELIDEKGHIQLQKVTPMVTSMETYFSLKMQGAWGDWKETGR